MKHTLQQNGDFESAVIRRLIGARLKARLTDRNLSGAANHPDDDLVNAFVEGQLEDAESLSVISHLVSCTSCLHLTAQLARFSPETDEAAAGGVEQDPGPLQRFFDRLTSGAMPISEDAVFAYEEKKEAGGDRVSTESDSDRDQDESKQSDK